jgi:hypothetical protein
VQRDIVLTGYEYLYASEGSPYIYNGNSELTFSTELANRVVGIDGKVPVTITTNALASPNDSYLLQLKFKEEVLS